MCVNNNNNNISSSHDTNLYNWQLKFYIFPYAHEERNKITRQFPDKIRTSMIIPMKTEPPG
jgi:hypothetical protein